MPHYLLIVIFLISIFSYGCTNSRLTPQADLPVDHINIQHRIEVANSLFKQHDYHASLVQWEILLSIQPNNAQYKNRIRVLNALIKRRTKVHLHEAHKALKIKDYQTAEWEFLKILAIAPGHKESIDQLKKIERMRAEKKQAKKTKRLMAKREESRIHDIIEEPTQEAAAQDNQQAVFFLEFGIDLYNKKDWRGTIREIEKYLRTNSQDKNAIKYVTLAHINLSTIYEQRGHLLPAIQHYEDIVSLSRENKSDYSEKLMHLRKKLSANYYIEGVKIYRENIDQAISYWDRALKINPENDKAAVRLQKAKKAKSKLSKLNKNQPN